MKVKSIVKKTLKYSIITGIWCLLASFLFIIYCTLDLPVIEEKTKKEEAVIKILYSNGRLARLYGDNENILKFSNLPYYLIDALVATEDRNFFQHSGVDYIGILRAFITNLKRGRIAQGGSTITQQLAKISFLTPEKTIKRKIQEFLLAKQLEKKYTKEEILEKYLSKAYFGSGQYGISSASQFYFDKSVNNLGIKESTLLVGLLKAPSKYSPKNNPDLAQERMEQVILNMQNANYISKNDVANYIGFASGDESVYEAKNENINYFLNYIKNEYEEYIGLGELIVKTTLNENIQKIAEKELHKFINENKKRLGKSQVAIVAINSKGEIISMIGGKNYKKSQFNRSTYAKRQAGSLFKLFVYIAGLENGLEENSTFIDEEIKVGNWYPQNYGKEYYGKVDIVTAFAKSLNSVAVQISEMFGSQAVALIAKKMGISSSIDEFDPTISLGSTEVNLLEIVSAYSVIANNGYTVKPYSISNVSLNGFDLYEFNKDENIRILKKSTVNSIKEMMFEVVNNGTGKNSGIDIYMEKTNNNKDGFFSEKNYFIGGKTGTSQNYRDAWFVGYVNDITLGIWIGNDDSKPTNSITGGSLPAILWKNIMSNINNIEN